MRWMYILTVIIPTLLGMFTTLVTLSIVVGPPVPVFAPPIPAELFIEGWNTTRVGGDTIVILMFRNPGDEGLFIHKIYVNETEVFSRRVYIEPKSGIREVSFVIPRGARRASIAHIRIVWSPEASSEEKSTYLTISLRP